MNIFMSILYKIPYLEIWDHCHGHTYKMPYRDLKPLTWPYIQNAMTLLKVMNAKWWSCVDTRWWACIDQTMQYISWYSNNWWTILIPRFLNYYHLSIFVSFSSSSIQSSSKYYGEQCLFPINEITRIKICKPITRNMNGIKTLGKYLCHALVLSCTNFVKFFTMISFNFRYSTMRVKHVRCWIFVVNLQSCYKTNNFLLKHMWYNVHRSQD